MRNDLADQNRLLSFMRMLFSAIDLQLGKYGPPQPVVRDHSFDRPFNQKFRAALPALLRSLGLVTADVPGEAHVSFLQLLLPGQPNLIRVDYDHKVARVNVRGEDSFSLAAEQIRNFNRNAAQRLTLCVDDEPFSI